jgi:hypothetical protein
MKSPLPGSGDLLRSVKERLGPNRLPLLIAVDGADGIGKSSLASWLAWQLGAPAIHLDFYLVRGSDPLDGAATSCSASSGRDSLSTRGPLIVEGILMLDALDSIGRKPDFLVYVDGEGSHGLSGRLAGYRTRYQPEQHADVRLQGFAE